MAFLRKYRIENIRIIFSGSVLTLWSVMIFLFSSQNGPESSKTSSELLHNILHVLTSAGLIKACDYSNERLTALEGILRNGAHFFEYAVLGSLTFVFISEAVKKIVKVYSLKQMSIVASTYVILISVSDEILQYFIPGRSFQGTDILTDLAGGVLGILIAASIYKRKKKA